MSGLSRYKPVLLLALILCLFCPSTALATAPRVSSSAAVLMDVTTGQLYFTKNAARRADPASLTKLMTAVVALESGKLDDVVTITGRSSSVEMGSIIDLRKGEKITLEELLKAALVTSANDSTVAIAEHVGGSHDRFVRMMNAKAVALGLFGTRYINTNGYHHPNHYTTARDLAVLTRYALGLPKINELVQTREATVHWVEPQQREEKIINSNRLLSIGYDGIDGVKTGTTPMAGNCLIASATRDGRRLIAVALNCYDRYRDCITLLDYGFEVVKPVTVAGAGEKVTQAAVTGGVQPSVDAVAQDALEVRIDPDFLPKLEQRLEIKETVPAPVKQGQSLGQAVYFLDGQEIGRLNLVAAEDVPRPGWHRQLWDKVFD
ncbi:D-alanyl-D-alanine carboxypeptidase DacB precursor [Pelotomaculum schinkii]|uniref:serine-type D-Ala-D-Ala carboxypeptidase n=1 Tax=Pelotomaculum schinkii TaxID=78350 RepID=A0A4Y7RAW8_9FIRM|nr:D-alanyl-D-alanine carboxypeptidase family protein [Pelotomaculum schinkii]TEB06138.1 D-alanyl-D-alanine carboxypeptidase DacB precursor [Pelotomaculum schinkii]